MKTQPYEKPLTLAVLLSRTGDHCTDYIGCKIVHPKDILPEYWHLSDFAVSTASSHNIYLVPRQADALKRFAEERQKQSE